MTITHHTNGSGAEAGDGSVSKTAWEEGHDVANGSLVVAKVSFTATDKVLGRSTSGAGNGEEIALTAAGRALIDDADASAQRTTLGLGTAATLATASLPGHEFDYVQITTSVTNVTATAEGSASTIITGSSVAYDGSTTVMIEFSAPILQPPTADGGTIIILLYEDSTLLGQLTKARSTSAGTAVFIPGHGAMRRTPSNASHTYTIKAIVSTGTGQVLCGSGGASTPLPAFLRITRV